VKSSTPSSLAGATRTGRRPRASSAITMMVALDPEGSEPLYRQLYRGVRAAILGGRLAPGGRVPSTRAIAEDLGISRNTVLVAFDQLIAEGYLIGTTGSGTRVASELPDAMLHVLASPRPRHRADGRSPALSRRGAALLAMPKDPPPPRSASPAFRPGVPAVNDFPSALWARIAGRRLRRLSRDLLEHGDPQGYRPLREAIAGYLASARGVRCEPGQVVMAGGTQQALDLAARVLLDPGDLVWLENPSYLGARGAFVGASAELVAVPVDEEGIDVAAGRARAPGARLAYVSPSHQYPLGIVLSLGRRLALLQWARDSNAWVLEDDYDSEYRYAGRPLMALQGLDTEERVIYLGTFSKTLFPALRLGYLIVPPGLVDAFVAARGVGDQHSPTLEQVILTDFIAEGHYARHVRRMRGLYRERQEALLEAAGQELAGLLDLRPSGTGLHLLGWLDPRLDDRLVSHEAARQGITTPPLSRYYFEGPARSGLLLGYAGVSREQTHEGTRILGGVIRSCLRQL